MKYLEMGGLRAMGESHPSRGAWIEIDTPSSIPNYSQSHPSRGAWIEISVLTRNRPSTGVAPLTGCVD